MITTSKVLKKIRPQMFMSKLAVKPSAMTFGSMRAMSSMHKVNYGSQGNHGYSKSSYNKLFPMAALSLAGLVGGWELLKNKMSSSCECCGIIGYIGQENIAGKIVLDGIQILQYRGYDSCGIVSIDEKGDFVLHKKSSSSGQGGDCIQQVIDMATGHHDHTIGIGHTRWATHGNKTDINAHPHYDLSERFAVVHNGMIENFMEIKNLLKENGIVQKSQTDTELIALYIKFIMDKDQ
jgi:hypothetical protein